MAASLYFKHFSLTSAPFPVTPDSDAYYTGGSRRATVDAVLHVLRGERGIVKVVGDAGTGKTTLCRHLARTLGKQFTVLYTCDPSLSGDQTWFALGDALRLPVRREDAAEAASLVRRKLGALYDAGRPALLLLDEAHAMPPETLEQIRLLAQREAGGETFRIVLLGPEELDHNLALPGMEALRTRVAHSVRLKRLKLSDIGEYLNFKMRAAGWAGAPVFNGNAVRAIAKLTGGVPRRINVLADKALLAAALDRRYEVSARDVAAAAREVRLARQRSTLPAWLIGAGSFAAGVAATALLGALALTAGWVPALGTGPAASTGAPPSAIVRPASGPMAPQNAMPAVQGLPPAPAGLPASTHGTASSPRPDTAGRLPPAPPAAVPPQAVPRAVSSSRDAPARFVQDMRPGQASR